jgi:hypothetical protein
MPSAEHGSLAAMNGRPTPMSGDFTSGPYSSPISPGQDFDRLMHLSRHDPVAFDAERRARLAIEHARSRHFRSESASLLRTMEKILAPLNSQERALISMRCMTLSLIQLNEVLQGFSTTAGKT